MRSLSRSTMLVLILLVLSITVGVSFGGEEERLDFSLGDIRSGESRSFEDILTSKANILVITETACYSCIKELQSLEALREKYRGDVSVTACFVDRQGAARILKYLEYYKFDLDNFIMDSSGEILSRFDTDYVPSLFIYDKKGNELFRSKGFEEGDEDLIASQVDEILYTSRRARRIAAATTETDQSESREAVQVRKTVGCAHVL